MLEKPRHLNSFIVVVAQSKGSTIYSSLSYKANNIRIIAELRYGFSLSLASGRSALTSCAMHKLNFHRFYFGTNNACTLYSTSITYLYTSVQFMTISVQLCATVTYIYI